jgi:8-oxo-dGTP pyrophosphatase MutT (NUDIX family)
VTPLPPFFERLQHSLRTSPSRSMESGGMQLKNASVLAPLFWRGEEPWAYVTMRPKTLRKHPGQIAFPGGGSEPADLTPLHTALRETKEELGIPPDQVQVLGMLGTMPTPTGFFVTPFVGVVPAGLTLTPNAVEIEQVLEVPLLHLREEQREFYHAMRDAFVWGEGDHAIWGATYRMMQQLLEHVRQAARD